MSDNSPPPLWSRAEPDSPCIRLCTLHPETRLCLGCHRTADEIAAWPRLSPEARAAIMAELPGRRPAPTGRRRNRRAKT